MINLCCTFFICQLFLVLLKNATFENICLCLRKKNSYYSPREILIFVIFLS